MGQHYVPQHYLRSFEVSDQPGMIWTYDKIAKTSKSLPIKLVAVLALFTVGDVYASRCKIVAYAPFRAQRRSLALFGL